MYCFKKELSQTQDLFVDAHQLDEMIKDYCLHFSDEKTEWLGLIDVSKVVYLSGRKNPQFHSGDIRDWNTDANLSNVI